MCYNKSMDIIKKSTDTLRVVSSEVIQHANSGHSGIALGAAPLLYAAYSSMKIDESKPDWFDRDRFVMSAGHGSALLYATLHLMGYPINKDDLKTFRRLGSHLHGHPEVNAKLGIDCSTGPLGQGAAMAVGLALAEKRLAQTYNKPGVDIIDHYTYCVAGDGCLQEGISYEATSLAGHWKLNKLIMLYDANEITLDGARTIADSEDVTMRFKAAQWNVIDVKNGDDATAIVQAIADAKKSKDKPTLIICRSTIGYGSKTAGTNKAHGVVLKPEETEQLRKDWNLISGQFHVDKDVQEHFGSLTGNKKANDWQKKLENYKEKFPKEYSELIQFINPTPIKLKVTAEGKPMATRDAGQIMLTQVSTQTPRLWGANADIASTTKAAVAPTTIWSDENPTGNMVACGIREFGMAGIANGLALHGFLSYCSTFLCFSDYLRSAMRLTALMDIPVTYIFSHDGIGNPPDGPTHQATEHLAALRIIPNLLVFRPCNDVEAAMVYKYVFETQKPSAIIVSRGGTGTVEIPKSADISKGGYIVHNSPKAKATILATGSEVSLALKVAQTLDINVVSMPCVSLFEAQSTTYKASVLDAKMPVIALEMGTGDAWYKYADHVISFDRFGSSGQDAEVRNEIGFTPEKISEQIKKII